MTRQGERLAWFGGAVALLGVAIGGTYFLTRPAAAATTPSSNGGGGPPNPNITIQLANDQRPRSVFLGDIIEVDANPTWSLTFGTILQSIAPPPQQAPTSGPGPAGLPPGSRTFLKAIARGVTTISGGGFSVTVTVM